MRTFTAMCLGLLLPLAGCDDPARRIARLEMELSDAQVVNARLKSDLTHAQNLLDQATGQRAQANRIPPEHWKQIPQANRIELGNYSSIRTGQPELAGAPATQPAGGRYVRLYLNVLDQDGFAMRFAGAMQVGLFAVAADSATPLGTYRFDADSVAKLYRNALGTRFYAADIPLPPDAPADVTAHVTITDYLTGRTLNTQKVLTGSR